MNYSVIDAGVLARIHGAGLKALVYTVNDPAAARWLVALGIDGIVTDAVDRFSPDSGDGGRPLSRSAATLSEPSGSSAPRTRA